MAFSASRASTAAEAIAVGDELFLYSSRGAFHNPGKHRGRVFGRAMAETRVEPLAEQVHLVDREFTHDCYFDLKALAPLHKGIELSTLVPRLTSFPNKTGWPVALRRPLMTLTPADALLIRKLFGAVATGVTNSLPGYLAEARTAPRP
jgi:hypothetical protein